MGLLLLLCCDDDSLVLNTSRCSTISLSAYMDLDLPRLRRKKAKHVASWNMRHEAKLEDWKAGAKLPLKTSAILGLKSMHGAGHGGTVTRSRSRATPKKGKKKVKLKVSESAPNIGATPARLWQRQRRRDERPARKFNASADMLGGARRAQVQQRGQVVFTSASSMILGSP